jgi:hypothetical protein
MDSGRAAYRSSPKAPFATSQAARSRWRCCLFLGFKEVRFPDYLTPEEEQVRREVSHVV